MSNVTVSGKKQTSSPIKPSLYSGFETSEVKAVEFRTKLADVMSGFFVGPMPVSEFLQDFLPAHDNFPPIPALSATLFDEMGKKFGKESDMADAFVAYVPKELIPGFKIVNTSDHIDKDSTKDIKPDPTLYREDLVTTDKKTQYNEIELNFELKTNDSRDPFEEKPGRNFEAPAIDRMKCRGQLVGYATEWCARQHRCFAFTVYMGDPFVRFIRWDRAGAVISAKYNYREDSRPLMEFLWRFCHLTRAQRGWDPTVRLANPEEVGWAHEKLSQWKHDLHRDVVVFSIPDGGKSRSFVAWGSMAYPESLAGRCTRAYPVYERATDSLYFLKDTWRAEGLEKESAILRELQAAKVQHIPGLVSDTSDTGPPATDSAAASIAISPQPDSTLPAVSIRVGAQNDHTTATPKKDAPWRRGTNWRRIIRRYHHRMITNVIGHHLKKFPSSKEMMQAISDTFTAHQQAYEKCTIIHRDISAHNILITDDGRGILNDWDMARYQKDIIFNGPRQHERTGTWQFMSCLLLMERSKLHTIQDDIESFLYIVFYNCLRYLPHDKRPELKLIMQKIFDDEDRLSDGTRLGGSNKMSLLHAQGRYYLLRPKGLQLDNNAPLTGWLEHMLSVVNEWILAIEDQQVHEVDQTKLEGLRLFTHQYTADQFFRSLQQMGWPSGDKAVNALASSSGGQSGSQVRSRAESGMQSRVSGSSAQKRRLAASQDADEGSGGSSSGKRKKSKTNKSQVPEGSRSFHSSMAPGQRPVELRAPLLSYL
ncbi:hypothetical protein FPV67DRAFT_1667597 [Lyophyllum atratum]|nr:hypothetical protein FPV67DRAFT_1667597 [Lyophyllum atratum]